MSGAYPVRSGRAVVKDDVSVGGRLMKGAQAEESLEGGHRGVAALWRKTYSSR